MYSFLITLHTKKNNPILKKIQNPIFLGFINEIGTLCATCIATGNTCPCFY